MGAYDKIMDERKQMVDNLIALMEQGKLPWKKEWTGGIPAEYYNPESGYRYRGGNRIKLMLVSFGCGYEDPRWLTFKQAQAKGLQVKKGEKAVLLEKWIFEEKKKVTDPDTGKESYEILKLDPPKVSYFYVFNGEQIKGMPELNPEEALTPRNTQLNDEYRNHLADQLIESAECPVIEQVSTSAYYSPGGDCLVVPKRGQFETMDGFIATLLHEMGHSTGHKSRLNRNILNFFGTKDYAKEELRAELSSVFSCAEFHIQSPELDENHAAYLQDWIQVLRKDPNELYRAAADAEKMTDRIVDNYRTKYDLVETQKQLLPEPDKDKEEPEKQISAKVRKTGRTFTH